nr:MAG TPA: hypothetical protein [Caudoviricetes sp.]
MSIIKSSIYRPVISTTASSRTAFSAYTAVLVYPFYISFK